MILIIVMMGIRGVARYFFDDSPVYVLTVCAFTMFTTLAYVIISCELMTDAIRQSNIGQGLNRIVLKLDEVSYEVYLVHALFVSGCLNMKELTGYWPVNIAVLTLVTVIIAVLLRWMSREIVYLIEKKRG